MNQPVQQLPPSESPELTFDLDWDDEDDTAIWTPPSEVLRVLHPTADLPS